jgi:hypothetical protein
LSALHVGCHASKAGIRHCPQTEAVTVVKLQLGIRFYNRLVDALLASGSQGRGILIEKMAENVHKSSKRSRTFGPE